MKNGEIACVVGRVISQVHAPRYREEWLNKIPQAGVRRLAELLYEQLDGLQGLRRTVRPELLAESRKHKAAKLLRQIPCIGPIRAARLLYRFSWMKRGLR
jgi:hypothetical protein